MKKNENITVLVVDDDGILRKSIATNLKLEDFNVFSASNGTEAIEIVKSNQIDFVLSDIRMPGIDGVKLLEKIRDYDAALPAVVLMSGFSEYSKEEVVSKGALDLILKPFDVDRIVKLIQRSVNAPEPVNHN